MNKKEKLQSEARATLLRDYITPSTSLIISIKSVSSSGMCRRMRVHVANKPGLPNRSLFDVSFLVSALCDLSLNNIGLKISGCGMDMTFWLADNITQNLWPDKATRPALTGNGGSCLNWQAI